MQRRTQPLAVRTSPELVAHTIPGLAVHTSPLLAVHRGLAAHAQLLVARKSPGLRLVAPKTDAGRKDVSGWLSLEAHKNQCLLVVAHRSLAELASLLEAHMIQRLSVGVPQYTRKVLAFVMHLTSHKFAEPSGIAAA